MNQDYFNTTNQSGEALATAIDKAKNQSELILDWFKTYERGTALSPSECYTKLFNKRVPITSVRRSFTALTAAGYLVKTTTMRVGIYGKPEHLWTRL